MITVQSPGLHFDLRDHAAIKESPAIKEQDSQLRARLLGQSKYRSLAKFYDAKQPAVSISQQEQVLFEKFLQEMVQHKLKESARQRRKKTRKKFKSTDDKYRYEQQQALKNICVFSMVNALIAVVQENWGQQLQLKLNLQRLKKRLDELILSNKSKLEIEQGKYCYFLLPQFFEDVATELRQDYPYFDDFMIHNLVVDYFAEYYIPQVDVREVIRFQYKQSYIYRTFGDKLGKSFGLGLSFIASVSGSILTVLAVAVLVSGPWGWALGGIAALVTLGMNIFLMVSAMKDSNSLRAANREGVMENIKFYSLLFFAGVSSGSGVTMNIVSTMAMASARSIPLVGGIIAGIFVALAGLYFFTTNVTYFLKERFAIQYQKKFGGGKKDKRALKGEVLILFEGFADCDIKQLQNNFAGDMKSNLSQLAKSNKHPLKLLEKTNVTAFFAEVVPAVISQYKLNLLTVNKENVDNNTINQYQILFSRVKQRLIQHLVDNLTTEEFKAINPLWLNSYVNNYLVGNHQSLGLKAMHDLNVVSHAKERCQQPNPHLLIIMRQEVNKLIQSRKDKKFHYADLAKLFANLNNIFFDYYCRQEKLNPGYKRPRRIHIHRQIVAMFQGCFVSNPDAKAHIQKIYDKKILSSQEIAKQQSRGRWIAFAVSIMGSLLPALALSAIPPPGVGFALAAIYFIASCIIDYIMVKQSKDKKLANKIDEVQELHDGKSAYLYSGMVGVLLYSMGNFIGRYKVMHNMASKALNDFPAIGIFIAAIIIGMGSFIKSLFIAGRFVSDKFSSNKSNSQNNTAGVELAKAPNDSEYAAEEDSLLNKVDNSARGLNNFFMREASTDTDESTYESEDSVSSHASHHEVKSKTRERRSASVGSDRNSMFVRASSMSRSRVPDEKAEAKAKLDKASSNHRKKY